MPRALVTGASGFVGSAVARQLIAAGWQVRALARPTSPRTNLDLPGLDELKGAGLLTARIPEQFRAAPPADPDALADDQDALSDIDLAELGLLPPRVEND